MYNSTARTIAGGPSDTKSVNLAHLPSDAVAAKSYGLSSKIILDADGATALTASKSYVVRDSTGKEIGLGVGANDPSSSAIGTAAGLGTPTVTIKTAASASKTSGNLADGDVITRTAAGTVNFVADNTGAGVTGGRATLAEVNTENAFVVALEYEVASLGTGDGNTGTAGSDAAFIKAAATNLDGTAISGTFVVGSKFLVKSAATTEQMAGINSLIQGMTFRRIGATNELTQDIEAVQAKINTARVQAGSQYAAMESAVDYTTDLTAQYELGFNTVNDVNFSMETAHLAKNQILQQAATAMLAQANQGQQGLLQLIQG
jgi:flagellin